MFLFACLWGWGSNSYHYSSIAHLKKIALPLAATSNSAFQPATDITGTERVQRLTYSCSFRWCAQLNCIMLFPKSLREVIVKHDSILSVISLCQKVFLIFENNLQPSQKHSDETKLQFSTWSYTHTLSLSLKSHREISTTGKPKQNLCKSLKPTSLCHSMRLCDRLTLCNVLSFPVWLGIILAKKDQKKKSLSPLPCSNWAGSTFSPFSA